MEQYSVTWPLVWKLPRVAIIPSGSEIVSLADAQEAELRSGQSLPEFNSLVFSAMLRDAGAVPVTRPIAPDDPEALRRALESAVEGGADMVIMNAGSSAGSHDFTADVIAGMGDLLVLLFFGLVPCCGTYFAATGTLTGQAWLAASHAECLSIPCSYSTTIATATPTASAASAHS